MDANAMNPEAWGQISGAETLSLEQMEKLINEYNTTWDAYEKQKEISTKAYDVFTQVEHKIIKALQAAHKTSYASEIGTVTLAVAASVKIPASAADKKEFFAYLESLGEDVLLGLATVNSAQLNSWYKKAREESGYAPDFAIPGLGKESERLTLKFKAKAV